MKQLSLFTRQRLAAAGFLLCILFLRIPPVSFAETGGLPPPAIEKLDPRLSSFYYDEATEGISLLKPPPFYRNDPAGNGFIPVIIETTGAADELAALGASVFSQTGGIVTCSLPIDALHKALALPSVRYVHSVAEHKPMLDAATPSIRMDYVRQTHPTLTGEGVLIGIYDTGIDWRHSDFIDETGKTRIRYLWDQTWNTTPLMGPAPYRYGREYNQVQIDEELAGTASGAVEQQDVSGHGTHVAGIAGGNGSATGNSQPAGRFVGVAPKAEFIIVKGGDSSFSSSWEIDGLNYMATRASQLDRPIVMNLSLGGHQGGHDGTSPPEQVIDELSGAGVIVVVSAGNDGSKNIHFGHTFSSPATTKIIDFEIPSYSANPGTGGNYNDYVFIEAWYSGSSPPAVSVQSPREQILGPVNPGTTTAQIRSTQDGRISITNRKTGDDYQIIIQVTDYRNGITETVPRAGTWRIAFTNSSGGRVDGWLYDSSMDARFSAASASREMLVAIPGTAKKAITVGAYKSKHQWVGSDSRTYHSDNVDVGDITSFSSPGPSRDGRHKPEITAPGQEVTSSKSQQYSVNSSLVDPDGMHVTLRGTSMSAPVVTGVVALMLQKNPSLTPEGAVQLLRNGARRDQFTGFDNWNKTWGYGKLDARNTLEMVTGVGDESRPIMPAGYELFQNYPNPFNAGTTIRYSLPKHSDVRIAIYSITGAKIREMVQATQEAGIHSIFWDGRNDAGQAVASNIYLLRMTAGDFYKTVKLALLK